MEKFIDLPFAPAVTDTGLDQKYVLTYEPIIEAGKQVGVRIGATERRHLNKLAGDCIANQQEEICQLRQLVEAHSRELAFPAAMRSAIEHAIACVREVPNPGPTIDQLEKVLHYCAKPISNIPAGNQKADLIKNLLIRGNRLRNFDGWNEYGEDMLAAAKMLQGDL